jgi:spore coat polysaccharide biosynthesis predicted glycosyltransferase SpsG
MVGPSEKFKSEEDKNTFVNWIPRNRWASSKKEAEFFRGIALEYSACHAILDDYQMDRNFQLEFRRSGIPWLQFDGGATMPLWADWVLNASPWANVIDYKLVLKNPGARLLLGPQYAILRSEFPPIKKQPIRRPVRQILVAFGGGDDRGAINFVLETLIPVTPNRVNFVVISGENNPRNQSNIDWISRNGMGKVNLKINPNEIGKAFAACDIAIVSGGTIAYEVGSCGLPMFLLPIAENQHRQCQAWADINAAINMGCLTSCDPDNLKVLIKKLCNSVDYRAELSRKVIGLNIGHGTEKVSKLLLSRKNN